MLREDDSISMKCIDQMPTPIANAPPASRISRVRAQAKGDPVRETERRIGSERRDDEREGDLL
ncbi:hypothetical protein LMG27177_01818 [Paraburkholderia fynbosensis]|uniref:Uncharacterized protein n=1 Tax=Paraburkholderia fynbosensis TaxID=1200993 RepID=A0A6J5FRG6_9BURK|nr:hypothetical protein LMG27177_01818 [Paraburkholderia fynbosensis]